MSDTSNAGEPALAAGDTHVSVVPPSVSVAGTTVVQSQPALYFPPQKLGNVGVLQPQLAQGEELPDVAGQPLDRVVRSYERLQELHRRYRLQAPQTIVAQVEPEDAEPRVARERVQQVSHVVVAPQVDAPHVVGPRAGQSPLQAPSTSSTRTAPCPSCSSSSVPS